MNAPQRPGAQPLALPRPQIGIERLPSRHFSNEPRESMNCKSCRKRKIKCNRLRPACEACQVFQCPCVYDAVPKKRGPKTDVLEALLKRVDGLEAKLKEKNAESGSGGSGAKDASPPPNAMASIESLTTSVVKISEGTTDESDTAEPPTKRIGIANESSLPLHDIPGYSSQAPPTKEPSTPPVHTDALLDTYFSRFHTKPYHILDESSIRQRLQTNQLPNYLLEAVAAVAARHTPHPNGYQAAAKLSEEYATRSRSNIDIDEPCIDSVQALLLLVIAFTAIGKGKKAYMLMTSAVGMVMAIELHREMDPHVRIAPTERETRRRIFWSCYLLDRYVASGSKRPSLISDDSIVLRLPSWSPSPSSLPMDGEYFLCGSNLQYFQGSGKKSQGSTGMLIDITRILGGTNRYLAAGGVKGDSHFPWHSLSNLSKIRQDLDVWASGTDNMFSSLDTLFGQIDSTVLFLSKLIYHLIHCLIYRPFLPINLAELAGNGQHQSWQIEATNMCFLHANAITDLTEAGRQANAIEWPSFVGYCICTAGTVHIHGSHYGKAPANGGEMNVFSSSSEFLTREMQHLGELRYTWAIVQHQREALRRIYEAHGELVKSITANAMRYTPGFQLEDFFDRYSNIGGPGGLSFHFDSANLSLSSDEVVDFMAEPYGGLDSSASWEVEGSSRPNLKRKNVSSPSHDDPAIKVPVRPASHAQALHTSTQTLQTGSMQSGMVQQNPPSSLSAMPSLLPTHMDNQDYQHQHHHQHQHNMSAIRSTVDTTAAGNASATGYGPTSTQQASGGVPSLAGVLFGHSFGYPMGQTGSGHGHSVMGDAGGFDPMFGTLPTNTYSSPAAWQGDRHRVGQTTPGAAAPSPSTKSNTGSTGTAGDEKDPFMSLLEQLANEEQRSNNGLGSDLDFFLAGPGGTS